MHKIITDFEIQHNKAFCDAIMNARTPTEQTVNMFNGYITRIYTLERALNRAMTTLCDIRNTLACPPDMDYADLAAEYANTAITEVDKILEVEQCE